MKHGSLSLFSFAVCWWRIWKLWVLVITGLSFCSASLADVTTPLGSSSFCIARPPIVSAWTRQVESGRNVFIVGDFFDSESTINVRRLDNGKEWWLRARWTDAQYLSIELPADAGENELEARVWSGGCRSASFRINVPQIWWTWTDGELNAPTRVRFFGRGLSATGLYASLASEDRGSVRRLAIDVENSSSVSVLVPGTLYAGSYNLEIWSSQSNVKIGEAVLRKKPESLSRKILAKTSEEVLAALTVLERGGGIIQMAAGDYNFREVLRIPNGVRLEGSGSSSTSIRFAANLIDTNGLVKAAGPSYPAQYNMKEPIIGLDGLAARTGVLVVGSDASLVGLTIDGEDRVEIGVAAVGRKDNPISNLVFRDLGIRRLAKPSTQHGRSEGLLARHVRKISIVDSVIRGNGSAIYLENVTGCSIERNELSGAGTGVIAGREGGVRNCIMQKNKFLSNQNGVPQAVRMIWLSTLFGSTYHNYIEGNRGSNFHPPPGTDQNRGEAILLETALSHPFFGRPAAVGAASISLPAVGPAWETLDDNDQIRGTRLQDYFVVVVRGLGQGQVRRVSGRKGKELVLVTPWRIAPNTASTIVLTELNYQNIIMNNEISDALIGILIWINGVENVIQGNRIEKVYRDGIQLFSDASGGPHKLVKRFWPIGSSNMAGFNRGLGLSYFNTVQGNSVSDAATGVAVLAGDIRSLKGPVDFPTSIGNSVAGNTLSRITHDGIRIAEVVKYTKSRTSVEGAGLVGNSVENNTFTDVPSSIVTDCRSIGLVLHGNRNISSTNVTGREAEKDIEARYERNVGQCGDGR